MHEVGIMQDTLDRAIQCAEQEKATRIHLLRMKIGVASGVSSEALQFAFEILAEGTMAEGGRLEVETVPLACRCRGCGESFTADAWVWTCPKCGSLDAQITGGRELELSSMDIS